MMGKVVTERSIRFTLLSSKKAEIILTDRAGVILDYSKVRKFFFGRNDLIFKSN